MMLSDQSTVWIYLSNRELSRRESEEINSLLKRFCNDWTAHGQSLLATGEVILNRFIVFMVDESHAGASGCSIDKSVHFLQEIERAYHIRLFDRMLIPFWEEEKLKVIPLDEFIRLLNAGKFNGNSKVFNTLAKTKAELGHQFLIPVRQSWLARYLTSKEKEEFTSS